MRPIGRWGLFIGCLIAAMLLISFSLPITTSAQDNLLTNGNLEEPYSGRGRADLNIPNGWNIWVASSPQTEVWMNLTPAGFPHRTAPELRNGVSLNLSKGFGTFTIAIYQQVSVPEGSNVTGSAFAWIHTCGDPGEEPTEGCDSSAGANGRMRVGIDPNGGTDPNDSDIIWSSFVQPLDDWGQASVGATATGGTVTLFIYSTQDAPRAFNNLYLDEASLTIGGTGGGTAQATPVPTAIPFVPFVSPQDEEDDGSILHTVRPGDTIDSIAFAYGVTRTQILELNGISDGRIIQIGQELQIRGAQEPEEEVVEETSVEEPADEGDTEEVVAFDEPPAEQPTGATLEEIPADAAPASVGQTWLESLQCTLLLRCGV
ncbi:MAG: LysM peptidoglycan-binding domain-containing protein [Burkholderiales bacterium]|nr:LysM peptidoglycan-binding domain-containing protein [Anaerolineae bacterium]